MPTPSIQTLRADAQQVLNLDSISAVRSVVAATLANANAGTPLNPNLTTQQLWNEFYQIVTQPKSDIESIIANQLMKFLYAPPAPGGAGADKQVIFNDGGVLAGDPQFLWNKTTNLLTVTGSATITGDLTVDTNVLAVNATTNAVGIGTTVAPVYSSKLRVEGGVEIHTSQALNIQPGNTNPYEIVNRSAGGFAFYPTGSALGMTLDASGNLSLANGNVVMGTSGKGIDFSATANGSGTMTSELLNDYEEGTWTPVVADASSGGNTGTCTINSAKYTKIGRLVSVQCDISGITTTGMTAGNTFFIRGLPFTSAQGGNGNFYTYRVGRDAATVSSSAFVVDSSSAIFFPIYTTNSATTDKSILVSDIVSTTSQIIVSVTYIV